jgi:hypothetical protein
VTGADPTVAGTGRDAGWSRRQVRAADGVLQMYARGISARARASAAPLPGTAGPGGWDRMQLGNRRPAADARRRRATARAALGTA